jgi:hypothetical protein
MRRGPVTVSLTSSTPGALIRYTIEGTTPSATVGTIYTSPFAITGKITVKAIAYSAKLSASPVVSSSAGGRLGESQ